MTLKTYKPYTKSRRGTILVDRSELWKGKPYKPLTSINNASKGRNNFGRITSRNHGGGHKQRYRNIDFWYNGVLRMILNIKNPRILIILLLIFSFAFIACKEKNNGNNYKDFPKKNKYLWN